jgi:hypothetical protein
MLQVTCLLWRVLAWPVSDRHLSQTFAVNRRGSGQKMSDCQHFLGGCLVRISSSHRSNPAKRRSQNLLALWCDLAALVVLSAMEHLLRAAVQGLSVTLANKSLFSYFMLN